jgi:asparagine synthase (glutamine-hydrolysing)
MKAINDTFKIFDDEFTHYDCMEKFILRYSFSRSKFVDHSGRQLLPSDILWRKKEAFSDGVSCKGRSLYQILQEYIALHMNIEEETETYQATIETEKRYYKNIFDGAYPNSGHILPYFWMPKYTDAKDPSARTLTFYDKTV